MKVSLALLEARETQPEDVNSLTPDQCARLYIGPRYIVKGSHQGTIKNILVFVLAQGSTVIFHCQAGFCRLPTLWPVAAIGQKKARLQVQTSV
ncbi:MAG: hypothetical protein CBB71_09670 [Rhodopirellula sp. TMED11]|nr:MAG: hypothetical protein CBB71_09670 [Rhodopirellula sp. TMED11]